MTCYSETMVCGLWLMGKKKKKEVGLTSIGVGMKYTQRAWKEWGFKELNFYVRVGKGEKIASLFRLIANRHHRQTAIVESFGWKQIISK